MGARALGPVTEPEAPRRSSSALIAAPKKNRAPLWSAGAVLGWSCGFYVSTIEHTEFVFDVFTFFFGRQADLALVLCVKPYVLN